MAIFRRYTPAEQQKAAALTFTPTRGGVLQRACACGQHTIAGGECEECSRKRVQASLVGARSSQRHSANATEPNTVPPIVYDVLRSHGQPLDPATRAFFEPRFGHDFSRVRVHADARAAESARAVDALAYTVGPHIAFGARQYVPETSAGGLLLAHELTHVVQCTNESNPKPYKLSSPNDELEKQAAISAEAIMAEKRLPPLSSGTGVLQRRDAGPPPGGAPPGGAPAAPPAPCCCCVTSLEIQNINRIDNATHMGHSFDTVIGLSYTGTGVKRSCTLEWWERTNVPYTAGMAANTWTDMTKLPSTAPSFSASWGARSERCPGNETITDTDTPSLGKTPGRTVTRTLEFKIVVKGGTDCACTGNSLQVVQTQVLVMVGGIPDWSKSRF